MLALLYSPPSGSISLSLGLAVRGGNLVRVRDRLHGVYAGAAPGHGVSQNVGKTNPHQPSGRFRKAPAVARECLNAGQPQTVGDVCLPKVPDRSESKLPTRSCGSSSSFLSSCATGERIKEALHTKLGPERFSVWFGGKFEIHVSESKSKEKCFEVLVFYDPNYPGDWLRKTFNGDVLMVLPESWKGL